ncbi:MAG: hypothetical protein LBQ88_04345, partial [Treponema sp.]|nr:hypothetical protein [Treponema sp.]
MAQKKFTRIHKMYTAGILLVCGLLLTSVDDCENMYLAEQDQASRIAQEQARRAEQERAAREWR